jgi:hypothetical protein
MSQLTLCHIPDSNIREVHHLIMNVCTNIHDATCLRLNSGKTHVNCRPCCLQKQHAVWGAAPVHGSSWTYQSWSCCSLRCCYSDSVAPSAGRQAGKEALCACIKNLYDGCRDSGLARQCRNGRINWYDDMIHADAYCTQHLCGIPRQSLFRSHKLCTFSMSFFSSRSRISSDFCSTVKHSTLFM